MGSLRCKVRKRKGSQELHVSAGRGSMLNEAAHGILQKRRPATLLGYGTSMTGGAEVVFEITRLETLSSFLGRGVTASEVRFVIGQVKKTIDECVENGLPLMNLVLDDKYVFNDTWKQRVAFAYAPLSGVSPDLKAMRSFFANLFKPAKAKDAEAQRVIADYADYFAANQAFNPIAYSEFLGTLLKRGAAGPSITQRSKGTSDLRGAMVVDVSGEPGTTSIGDAPAGSGREAEDDLGSGPGTTVLGDGDDFALDPISIENIPAASGKYAAPAPSFEADGRADEEMGGIIRDAEDQRVEFATPDGNDSGTLILGGTQLGKGDDAGTTGLGNEPFVSRGNGGGTTVLDDGSDSMPDVFGSVCGNEAARNDSSAENVPFANVEEPKNEDAIAVDADSANTETDHSAESDNAGSGAEASDLPDNAGCEGSGDSAKPDEEVEGGDSSENDEWAPDDTATTVLGASQFGYGDDADTTMLGASQFGQGDDTDTTVLGAAPKKSPAHAGAFVANAKHASDSFDDLPWQAKHASLNPNTGVLGVGPWMDFAETNDSPSIFEEDLEQFEDGQADAPAENDAADEAVTSENEIDSEVVEEPAEEPAEPAEESAEEAPVDDADHAEEASAASEKAEPAEAVGLMQDSESEGEKEPEAEQSQAVAEDSPNDETPTTDESEAAVDTEESTEQPVEEPESKDGSWDSEAPTEAEPGRSKDESSEKAPEPAPEPAAAPAAEPAPAPAPAEPAPAPEPTPEPASATDSSRSKVNVPALPPTFWLTHEASGERVRIHGKRFVVGKSKYSNYQVRNTTTVSRSHALFHCEDDACWVEDDSSRNGTFVNGERLAPNVRKRLEDGDAVRMSDEMFTFKEVRGR